MSVCALRVRAHTLTTCNVRSVRVCACVCLCPLGTVKNSERFSNKLKKQQENDEQTQIPQYSSVEKYLISQYYNCFTSLKESVQWYFLAIQSFCCRTTIADPTPKRLKRRKKIGTGKKPF